MKTREEGGADPFKLSPHLTGLDGKLKESSRETERGSKAGAKGRGDDREGGYVPPP